MTTRCTCVKITRTDGEVFAITDLDEDIAVGSVAYKSLAGYTPSTFTQSTDLSVGNADLEGLIGVLGIDRSHLRLGLFDHAKIEAYLVDYSTASVIVQLGSGTWGETTIKNGRYTAEYRSLSQKLQSPISRVVMPTCDAAVFDSRCGANKGAHSEPGAVVSSSAARTIVTVSLSAPAGHYNGGIVEFTSGENTGAKLEVKSHFSTGFEMYLPATYDILPGDTFVISAGCDKSLNHCKTKFNNVINFRGFPHLPGRSSIGLFGGQT